MGTVLAQERDIISFAPGYPAPETFPWHEFQEIAARAARRRRRQRAAVRTDARLPAAARGDRRRSWTQRGVADRAGPAAGHDRIAAGARPGRARARSIRATSSSSSCRPTPAPSPRSATSRRRWSACRRKPTASTSTRSTRPTSGCVAEGRRVRVPLRRPELPESDRAADRPGQAAGAARVGRAPRRPDRRGRSVSRAVLRGLGDAKRTSGRSRPTTAKGASIYLSSFSKTLAPGYRVAWIDAPAPIAAKLEMAKQAADLCTGGFDQRSRSTRRAGAASSIGSCPMLRAHYQHKRDVMVAALQTRVRRRRDLAGAARRILPVGDAAARHRRRRDDPARRRARRDLRRRRGVLRERRAGSNLIRLSFSAPTPERIREGVARLAAAVREELAARRPGAIGTDAGQRRKRLHGDRRHDDGRHASVSVHCSSSPPVIRDRSRHRRPAVREQRSVTSCREASACPRAAAGRARRTPAARSRIPARSDVAEQRPAGGRDGRHTSGSSAARRCRGRRRAAVLSSAVM